MIRGTVGETPHRQDAEQRELEEQKMVEAESGYKSSGSHTYRVSSGWILTGIWWRLGAEWGGLWLMVKNADQETSETLCPVPLFSVPIHWHREKRLLEMRPLIAEVSPTRRATAPAGPGRPAGRPPASGRSDASGTGRRRPSGPSPRRSRARSGLPPPRPRLGSPPG